MDILRPVRVDAPPLVFEVDAQPKVGQVDTATTTVDLMSGFKQGLNTLIGEYGVVIPGSELKKMLIEQAGATTNMQRRLIKNETADPVSYGLRRVYNRVLVKVQALGSNLVWQLYGSDPGAGLARSRFVHFAESQPVPRASDPPAVRPQPTGGIERGTVSAQLERDTTKPVSDRMAYYVTLAIQAPPDQPIVAVSIESITDLEHLGKTDYAPSPSGGSKPGSLANGVYTVDLGVWPLSPRVSAKPRSPASSSSWPGSTPPPAREGRTWPGSPRRCGWPGRCTTSGGGSTCARRTPGRTACPARSSSRSITRRARSGSRRRSPRGRTPRSFRPRVAAAGPTPSGCGTRARSGMRSSCRTSRRR